ncbi:MAG: DegT/DnrJ/EryC1/StrS family aminotransferase [Bacteroidota bacterium]
MNHQLIFKEQLAKYLATETTNMTLFWKGRVGLYGMLKTLGIGPGDEVIIPAFTCIVVPNAVLYLGAKPVYVDIDPQTYNIDIAKIEAKVTTKTKAILAQNTYGLSSDVDGIKAIAQKYQLMIIEDCTHGFGGTYKGKLNGKNVDAAFYSSQWNKMFSTGIGGFVICSNPEMAQSMLAFEQEVMAPSSKEQLILRAQLLIRDWIGYSKIYWLAIKFYRFLAANNIGLGSSSGDELTGIEIPKDYLKGFSAVQAKRALYELERLPQNIKHRQKVAAYYDQKLGELGHAAPFQPDYAMHTFTKYPLLVKDRDFIFAEAEKADLPIHDWFISPLHPVQENLELWHFDENQFPVAGAIARHVINLPTDFSVNEKLMTKVGRFLAQHQSQLLSADALLDTYQTPNAIA